MNSKMVQVVKRSKWTKGGKGSLPARVVLWHRKSDDSYITHMEVKNENGTLSFIWGHYDMTKAQAIKDFNKRVKSL